MMYGAPPLGSPGGLAGHGTWQREAHHVVMLAAELDLPLDGEMVILADARELLTLRLFLQRALRQGTRPAGAVLAASWPPHWTHLIAPRRATPAQSLCARAARFCRVLTMGRH